jgi:hypothetical protein
MVHKIEIQLTENELSKLINLAKKGTMCKQDRDLIKYLEGILKHHAVVKSDTYWVLNQQLDEIPF